ncbi:extensin-like [Girardinichthys multiradiatus]|uniref:extensin-like n=1 Tax=Girardinichthys multiradiatus TaxID=208333 RepID=UPI001FACC649|nr:extensin-like [Girardinichthys multiradiatus]
MRAHDQNAQPPPDPRGRANRAPSPRSPAPDSSHNQVNRDHWASRAVKQTPRCTTPPTTMPKGKMPAQQAKGCHRKAPAHGAKRSHPHAGTQTHVHPGTIQQTSIPHSSTRPRSPTQKAREPTVPKPKPIRKPRPIHPETNPGKPAHLNHADPSKPPPPDRKGTGVSNRNQDKEPETEPEPPKTKQRPQPSKANHPSPPQEETYTHPSIRTTPRAHKTLDTQVDPAPPPPTDPAECAP